MENEWVPQSFDFWLSVNQVRYASVLTSTAPFFGLVGIGGRGGVSTHTVNVRIIELAVMFSALTALILQ